MNQNTFTTFYKYPDPKYVIKNINHEDRVQKDAGAAPPANRRRLEGEEGDPVSSNDAQNDPVAGDTKDGSQQDPPKDTKDDKTKPKDVKDSGNSGASKNKNDVPKDVDVKKEEPKDVVKFIEPSFRPVYTTEMT